MCVQTTNSIQNFVTFPKNFANLDNPNKITNIQQNVNGKWPLILGGSDYYLKADKSNSLKYYELLSKYGDEQLKMQAQEKIAELKKKN